MKALGLSKCRDFENGVALQVPRSLKVRWPKVECGSPNGGWLSKCGAALKVWGVCQNLMAIKRGIHEMQSAGDFKT